MSFSFFLCPFSLHPHSLPQLQFYLFFCLFLPLPYLSLFLPGLLLLHFSFLPVSYLSHFLCLTLSLPLSNFPLPSFLSLSILLFSAFSLSLKVLIADGSRALITRSQLPSQAGHTLLALVTDCLHLPETSINDSWQEAFV